MDSRDSGRKDKAVEHLVAARYILISGMELNVTTSLVDDEGVDLVFRRRDVPITLAVQVKLRSMHARTIADEDRFLANAGADTFVLGLISCAVSSVIDGWCPSCAAISTTFSPW